MNIIKPTVGRKVWYFPGEAQVSKKNPDGTDGPGMVRRTGDPLDATVLCVWSDRCVNLQVVDHAGQAHFISSATLAQEGDAVSVHGHAEWMPYQQGQAKKASAPPPRTDDAGIEQEIQTKGLTAPRVTPADIEAEIASEHYFTADQGVFGAAMDADGTTERRCKFQSLALLTFCVLVLRNGFTVVGKSACASPENFDAELGRKIARFDAVNQIWPLLGYELRSKLAQVA